MEGCSSLILVNRTLSKVQALSEDLRLLAAGSPAPLNVLCLADHDPRIVDSLRDVDLVLQCSSVGMQPSDPSPLPREALHSKLRVYDMIYSNKTRLLIDAEHAGAKTSNGLSMLLHQGALAFEGWFNREAPVDKMRSALLAAVNS
jgi:shikimate dehydrogenase